MEPNSEAGNPVALNGILDDGPASSGVGGGAIKLAPFDYIVVQAPDGISSSVRNESIGNWLVQAVPEPSTALLLATARAALAWRVRKGVERERPGR